MVGDNKQVYKCQVVIRAMKEKKSWVREQNTMGVLLCRVVREDLSEEVAWSQGRNLVREQPQGDGA